MPCNSQVDGCRVERLESMLAEVNTSAKLDERGSGADSK